MYRMEVRCCCQPEKVLGTLPVPDRFRTVASGTITYPVAGSVDWRGGRAIARSSITFEVGRWAIAGALTPELRKTAPRFTREPEALAEVAGGLALKHDNVTLETLRRVPGFLEAK